MDKQARKRQLEEIQKNESYVAMTGIPLQYRGQTLSMKVYKIPLSFLVYNKHNGRIASLVFSYQEQNGELDPEKEVDKKIIEGFLWESKKDRNEYTLQNLEKNRQQRYGIVTADGIIVDGNRRAMLLNKLFHEKGVAHAEYFLAIILPQDANDKDINQLEALYQLGEDDKLDYNSIEKYLKCRQLKQSGTPEPQIADLMGINEKQIKRWLAVLELMDKYLEEYGYKGMYTCLKEDTSFSELYDYLASYEVGGANTKGMDWEPKADDRYALRTVCFDYIRAGFDVRDIREIAKTGKKGSFFFYEDMWNSFCNEHEASIPIEESVDELRVKYPDADLSKLLKGRDADWAKKAKDTFELNLEQHKRKLEDKRDADKPAALVSRALSTLRQVGVGEANFTQDPSILPMVVEIEELIAKMKQILGKGTK